MITRRVRRIHIPDEGLIRENYLTPDRDFRCFYPCEIIIIRIYHEYEGRIEKSVHRDHRLASQGLPSDDKR